MKKIIQYMCVVMGALFMLLACQDDAAIINPDVTHGRSTEGVETVNSKGALNSTFCPESKIVLLSIGDPTLEGRDETDLGRKDELCLILPKPLEKDITLKIAMEDAYANNETMKDGGSYTSFVVETFRKEYKIKTQGFDLNIPGNNGLGNTLSLNGGKEAIVTLSLALAAGSAMTSFAAGFTGTGKGVKYQWGDGAYCTNNWVQYKNHWFYFGDDQLMRTGWIQKDGTWYYAADTGELQGGIMKINGNVYYFDTSTCKMVMGNYSYNGCLLYTSPSPRDCS